MKNTERTGSKKNNQNESVEVLYQKLGDRWFAFSMIEGEVFVGSLTAEELEAKAAQETPVNPKKRLREFQ